MKEAIIGYVTALINNHSRKLGKVKEVTPSGITSNTQIYINELNDLLDFVEDSKEEEPHPQLEMSKCIDEYAGQEAQIGLLERGNKKLRDENRKLTAKLDEREKTNSKLMQQNESIGRTCNSLFKENKELRQTLKEVLPFLPQGCRDEVRKVLEGNK